MTQARGSMDVTSGAEDPSASKNTEDGKKTQAQRLFEFEMWTNETTLKDLEYSQRRTEKQQRRRERKKNARNRRWKKLYIPAAIGTVGGTFITLCGTVESLGGDTFLWEARGLIIIVGPFLLGVGLLCLMLAAGCTFEYDQQARLKSEGQPSEFLLLGLDLRDNFSRPAAPLRSVSMDTTDMPVPDDLDPSTNYVVGRLGPPRGRNRSITSRTGSISSSTFLMSGNSYHSTASWVQSLSSSHGQHRTLLTCQNSDSNLLSSAGRCDPDVTARRSLVDTSEIQDHSGSRSDLHVVCTRSLTSSGYQSASDSTNGTVEYQVSSENSKGITVRSTNSATLKQSVRLPASGATTHTQVQESRPSDVRQNTTVPGIHKRPVDSAALQILGPLDKRDRCIPHATGSSRNTASLGKSSSSSRPTTIQGICKHDGHQLLKSEKYLAGTGNSEAEPVLLITKSCDRLGADSPQRDDDDDVFHTDNLPEGDTTENPVALEPKVYGMGTVRCTDL